MDVQLGHPGRYRDRAHVRPAALAALTLTLASGGGLWLNLVHDAEGGTGFGAPSGLVGWLLESALLLPFVLVGVWAALLLGQRLVRPLAEAGRRVLAVAATATLVAGATGIAMAMASPLHAILFGAPFDHHGVAIPMAAYMASDGLTALAANFAIAGLVLLLLRGEVWSQASRSLPLRLRLAGSMSIRRAFALASSAVLVASSGLLLPIDTMAQPVLAASGPCPAGAPTKTFDVSAIDIRMDLNRFGDNDPLAQMFVLNSMIPAVRAQEAAGASSLTIGLRDDPIQPLSIRANEGDCVVINFTNATTRPAPLASTNTYGLHIDGLAFDVNSSGDAIGNNPVSSVPQGGTTQYTYWVPNDPTLEGGHYMHPGPANRQAVAHGLFGALVVEPPGSTYRNPTTGLAQISGWEADIIPGDPTKKSFREDVKIFHEIGNESEKATTPVDINGQVLPTIDPHTGAYRPGSRAINYRSEPFMDRLNFAPDQKAVVYGSYTFADTTNIIPRGYLGDPTKFRLMHAGTEVFHVYHLHGGSDRWRFNPLADPTYDYGKTGLDKHPVEVQSESARLDSQSIGPGESFNLEIENGAGGAQQGAGEFLFHCHIAHHYFAGMWGYWRVFDTLQPDLMPLPDRTPLAKAVDSSALVGQTINGQTITASNLDAWIRPQLPVQGVTHSIFSLGASPNPSDTADQDASVWDWSIDPTTGVYLGEPDRAFTIPSGNGLLSGLPWPDFSNAVPGHPAALVVDQSVVQGTWPGSGSFPAGGYIGTRPKILFNPVNGRPAWPMLRPHIGKRPPFSANGHSGAPYLGEYGGQTPVPAVPVGSPVGTTAIDPWANRADGICPAGAPLRTYNIVGVAIPITVTDPNKGLKVVDPLGALDVLASDKAAVLSNTKVYAGVQHNEPLAIRANIGDCIAVTYTSELTDGGSELPYSRTNIHIHHVQFDTQASDGVISGFSYEQSIRPYKIVDPQLTSAAAAGATTLALSSVVKFQPGVWIAVGQGTDGIEIRQIVSINGGAKTVTISKALANAHPANEWAGTEFVQYRWYPDVELDNIFFHDHVNGIHGWSHGMVGQLIIEPTGSTYHDPVTGAPIRAGAAADIHTDPTCTPTSDPVGKPAGTSNQCSLIPGVVPASYREFAVWTINDHEPDSAEATLNLRAEPFTDRTCGIPSRRFSATCGGDPYTPILSAYVGDPVVIRNINVGQGTNTLTIDGHQTFWEPRYRDALGIESSPIDTIHTTVSEKFTLILKDGAGGPNHVAGDYIYHDGENRRFVSGAWGILRVLPTVTAALQPLPGYTSLPAQQPTCPVGAPIHSFDISAVDLPSSAGGGGKEGTLAAFVPTSQAAAVIAKTIFPEPLVMHVAAGECIQVTLHNQRAANRASFHVGALLHDLDSAGINVGTNPLDQTIAPGGTKTYTYFADTQKLESTTISDFGGDNSGLDGMYGSVVVAPDNSTFTDPTTGLATDVGSQVDVHVPGKPAYRDFTLMLADHDPQIGQSKMPYPSAVKGPALINYRTAGVRGDTPTMFSSPANGGDPATPLLRAYAGDPVKVHVLGTPASEQVHVFSLGGMAWPSDMYISNASAWESRGVGPWEKIDASIVGGAGGATQQPGDYFYGDMRRAFTEAGMWGLFRVLPNTCQAGGTAGLVCLTATVPGATYNSLTPARILDTRDGTGLTGTFSSGTARTFQVTGNGGVPAGAVAVTGNLTVTEQTSPGFVSLTPSPDNSPTTSTLNFPLGDNRANGVTVALSPTGQLSATYMGEAGPTATTQLIFDVSGYFMADANGATYVSMTPARNLDTRNGTGLSGTFSSLAARTFQVTGLNGVPNDAVAVTGNLTVTNQTSAGFVTIGPDPTVGFPTTSTLNFPVGDNRANGVTVALSGTGTLSATYAGEAGPSATTDLVFDVTGYFTSHSSGATYEVLTAPTRFLDTRDGTGLTGAFSSGTARTLQVDGTGGVPLGAVAITGNLTVTNQASPGFLALTPLPDNNPTTSTLNFPLGDNRANGVTVALSAGGALSATYMGEAGPSATTDVVFDVTGYFHH